MSFQKLRQLKLHETFKQKKFTQCSVKVLADKSIKELKQKLLKNNSKYQIYAASNILKQINHLQTKGDKAKLLHFINRLIDADLIEIICQVMATLDIELLGFLFMILNHMKLSEKFFEFHRLSSVTDSLLRTLIIIFKQHRKQNVTKDGIKLLTSILHRKNQKYFTKQIFKQENLLNFIKKLFADGYGRKNVQCYPEILTYTVLLNGDHSRVANHNIIIDIFESSIKFLYRKIKSDFFDPKEKLIFAGLLSSTIELFIRRFITVTQFSVLEKFPILEMIKFLASYSMQIQEHGIVSSISQCVLTSYQTLDPKDTNNLMEYLVKEGILKYLICMREYFLCKSKVNTVQLINNLLIRQMTFLCETKFISNAKWERMFTHSFTKLSSDIKSWSLLIKTKDHLDKIQVTVYVFAYFYYTSLPTCFESKLKQLDQLISVIPEKITYLNQNIDFVYIKILMFLFAVSMLLNYNDQFSLVKHYTKPFSKLKRYASTPEVCKIIYTEHRDFMDWILSESANDIPFKIKYDFINRWISDKKTNNVVLQSAAEKEKRVALLLLLLLTQCDENIILPLYSILKNILQSQKLLKKKQRFLKDMIWGNFMFVFDKYKNNESLAYNLISYIYLAIEDVPKANEYNFCSIVSLTLSSLSVHSLNDKTELHIAFLKLIFFLVSQFYARNGSTELNVFISNKNFLEFMKRGLFSDDKEIFTLSTKLVSVFDKLRCSNELDLHIEMESDDLNLIMRKDIHKAFNSVKLFVIAIPHKGLKPFFCVTMLTVESIRQIYFNLLSVAVSIPHKSKHCWKSLVYILDKHEDKMNLAISPWTVCLIDYIMTKTQLTFNDLNWLSFLKSWLITLQPLAGSWRQEGLFSCNTVSDVLNAMSAELILVSSMTYNADFIIIAKLVLNLKVYIRKEIKKPLKEISEMK